MIIALLAEHGGKWIFTAPPDVPAAGSVALAGDITLHPVDLAEEVRRKHYDTISIDLLLGMLHYMHDTSVQPVFDADMLDAWSAYEAVNETYAKRLGDLVENAADELILINDPHLMLVPSFFAGRFPRRESKLAYFLGTPWCEPDYFGILPGRLRTSILESLLQCDTVGFHAERWADAFLACCERYLDGVQVDGRTVAYGDKETRIVAVPFPVDVNVLERMRAEPATGQWAMRLADQRGGRRMMVRADRLDLWKNIPRGFAAYETLLSRRPEFADECWFVAVVTTPSRANTRHNAYQDLTEATVARINEKFGNPGREAVSLVYPGSGGDSRNAVVAALGLSSAAFVNSTYDGLNLFAKEAAFLLDDGAHLLLSGNAGVYEQLAPYAGRIDPFDLEQTCALMESALDGAADPGGPAAPRRDLLRAESPASWLSVVFPP